MNMAVLSGLVRKFGDVFSIMHISKERLPMAVISR